MNQYYLTTHDLQIPLKHRVTHPSNTFNKSSSIIVEVGDGRNIGYGEGCPRSYVTNETISSASAWINENKEIFLNLIKSDAIRLGDWVAENKAMLDQHQAAWCAVETAVLDFKAKQNNESIENFLSIKPLQESFRYTAVITSFSLLKFIYILRQYLKMNFTDYKLKLSGSLIRDKCKAIIFKFLTRKLVGVRLRWDANNYFKDNFDQAYHYLNSLKKSNDFWAIEEPFKVSSPTLNRRLCNQLNIKIVLDESACSLSDFEQYYQDKEYYVVNIRLSKNGGLIRSLSLVKFLEREQIPLIIGSQVAETSILTRLALALVSNCKLCIAQEGAFGTLLLSDDVVSSSIRFNKNSMVFLDDYPEIKNNSGLGLLISKQALLKYSVNVTN